MLHADDAAECVGHTGQMFQNADVVSRADQAATAAARAAEDSRMSMVAEHEMTPLKDVADLLISIWGTSQHGAPIPADLLRSIGHAGCNVSTAYDASGVLAGAAVGIVSPDRDSVYSLIAGVRRGLADAGVGFALKQHQRAWALARGLTTMEWTFDPLVSRNARFNLTKLGATTLEYIPNFYGVMEDTINANDESDRLVAVWSLASDRAVDCSENRQEKVALPEFTTDDVLAVGPDGAPVLISAGGFRWCRVPADIVALRAVDSAGAAAWRHDIRTILTDAFEGGWVATGMTRTGWYRLDGTTDTAHDTAHDAARDAAHDTAIHNGGEA